VCLYIASTPHASSKQALLTLRGWHVAVAARQLLLLVRISRCTASREEWRASQHVNVIGQPRRPQERLNVRRRGELRQPCVKLGAHKHCARQGRVNLGQAHRRAWQQDQQGRVDMACTL
jgi:hypothetical protein